MGYVLSTVPSVGVDIDVNVGVDLSNAVGHVIGGFDSSDRGTTTTTNYPSNESSFFFAMFLTVYLTFYNFVTDLNHPFTGVYQIRRSSIAAHLLQVKQLIMNHPFLKHEIDFEE